MEMTPFFFGLYKFVKYGVYPLTWIAVLLGAALVLAWLPPSPRRLRWIRVLTTTGFLLLCLVSSPLVSGPLTGILEGWYPPMTTGATEPFDAIVVLGGGIRDKGTLRPTVELSSESRHRTLCGAELFQQGMAPRILLTGGTAQVFGSGPAEAAEMKQWAIRLGVPPGAALTEERSRTTYENALETKRLLGNHSAILLVTSANHIARATGLFTKQGFRVTPYPCGFHQKNRPADWGEELTLFDLLPSASTLKHTSETIEETAGIVTYWLAGKI